MSGRSVQLGTGGRERGDGTFLVRLCPTTAVKRAVRPRSVSSSGNPLLRSERGAISAPARSRESSQTGPGSPPEASRLVTHPGWRWR